MDFSFSEEADEVAALAGRILSDHLSEERMRAVESQADRFDADLYAKLATAGMLSELNLIELCRVLVEVGRAVAPVPILGSAVGALTLASFDGDESLITSVREGAHILAAAITEELNLDPLSPTTRADGMSITGTKILVAGGTVADSFLVSAQTEDGPALFVVPAAAAKVTPQIVTNRDADAIVEFTGAQASARLPGDSLPFLVRHLTVGLCAMQLGVVEKALELTAEYSKVRVQFDRPIATFQAVGQRLADAFIDVGAVRLTLWQAAWRLAEGLPADQEIATAKFWASDAGHRVAHTTVHVHGGVGIDLDHPAHRYFVAAKRIEFVLGTATDQLRMLGAALAAEPA